MKYFFLTILLTSTFVFQGFKTTYLDAPCNWLYASNQSQNSDDLSNITITNVQTGQLYSWFLGSNGGDTELSYGHCGTYNVSITVSIGAINSAVGIKNKSTGQVYNCQTICCREGAVITFNNVNFSNIGPNIEFFLKNGPC